MACVIKQKDIKQWCAELSVDTDKVSVTVAVSGSPIVTLSSFHTLPENTLLGHFFNLWFRLQGPGSLKTLGGERAIVIQTNIGTISEAVLGKLLRDGVELFRAHR